MGIRNPDVSIFRMVSRFGMVGTTIDIYRQSPVKSPDKKNIIVVTLTYLYRSINGNKRQLLLWSRPFKSQTIKGRSYDPQPDLYPLKWRAELGMQKLLLTPTIPLHKLCHSKGGG